MHQLHQLPLQALPERLMAVSSHVSFNSGPWASKASQPNSLLLYHTRGSACPELLNVVVQLDSLLLGVSTRLRAVKPHINHLMQLELRHCARLCDALDRPGAKVGDAQADHLPACHLQGAAVSASDISSSMANEARRRYEEAVSSGEQPPATPPTFSATDLESISGSFDTVVCLDVMIHYPQVDPHPPPCSSSPAPPPATESRLSERAAWQRRILVAALLTRPLCMHPSLRRPLDLTKLVPCANQTRQRNSAIHGGQIAGLQSVIVCSASNQP